MIYVHEKQIRIEEQKDANEHRSGLFKKLRTIDDDKIRIDSHYNELIKLQRESIDAIGTSSYEETKKALRAKEAQVYNDLADQHERFADNGRVFSYINGTVTSIEAGLTIFYVASGSNPITVAIAGAISVFAAGITVFSVHFKNKNEDLAAIRRKKAKSLEEEAHISLEATLNGSFY